LEGELQTLRSENGQLQGKLCKTEAEAGVYKEEIGNMKMAIDSIQISVNIILAHSKDIHTFVQEELPNMLDAASHNTHEAVIEHIQSLKVVELLRKVSIDFETLPASVT
jgi:hypothetical protein